MSAIASMTGFARIDGQAEGLQWTWEARSVNGRGLDIRVRAPGFVDQADKTLRQEAARRFKRGSIQATLTVERDSSRLAPRIDHAALGALLEDIAAVRLPEGAPVAPAQLDGLLRINGVLVQDAAAHDDTEMRSLPVSDIAPLLDALAAARLEEGARLATVLAEILDRIGELAGRARELASRQPEILTARYREAMRNLIGDLTTLPEDRIVIEAAALAVKADVAEELERLSAHVAQARGLLAEGGPIGRRFDFLTQEFNREANTLGAKSVDLELTRVAMDLKAAIDALREQIQNVE